MTPEESHRLLNEMASGSSPRAESLAVDERLVADLSRARALRSLGDEQAPDLLLGALDRADSLGRGDLCRLAALELGVWFLEEGELRLARAHLERALEESQRAKDPLAKPSFDRAGAELARAYAVEGDATRSRATLALIDPTSPYALLARGHLAQHDCVPDDCEDLFRRALAAHAQLTDPLEAAAFVRSAFMALTSISDLPAPSALAALGTDRLAPALAAVLRICAASEADAGRVAVEAIRELTGAAGAELELGSELHRSPAEAGDVRYDRSFRRGRASLKLRGGGDHSELLAQVMLLACARLGGPPANEAVRVLHMLDLLLGSDLEGSRLLELATQLAVEATGAARGRVMLLPRGLAPGLETQTGEGGADFVSRSLLRRVVLTGRPLLLEDAAGSPPSGAGESVGARGLRSVLVVPLQGRRGQVLGALYLDDPGTIGRFGSAELAVASGFAARLGPQVESHLRSSLRRDARLTAGAAAAGLVTSSQSMRGALALLEKAAQSDAPVLISGESGVGKEHFARAIQRASARKEGPFVVVPCGTLADQLIESELFGHRAGAFTGAVADRPGHFQTASGGVLFLEGLDDASSRMQAELLRAVETGEVRPLGGEVEQVDVRVMASFNGDPVVATTTGRLRQDLFYRLSVLHIGLPPLRQRRADLPGLVVALLGGLGAGDRRVEAGVLEKLERYAWPGNQRELQACLERALLEASGGPIRPEHVLLDQTPRARSSPEKLNSRQLQLISSLEPGQEVRAGEYAEPLGISPATAWRDLSDLVEKGFLVRRGKGRGASYRLSDSA